jgi:hypothetical protein
VAAKAKLTDQQVKRIRRRVRAGELIIDLAEEFGVDRKTIRRRLDALERAEAERAERIAAKRRRSQAARELRKLLERERERGPSPKQRAGRSKHTAPGTTVEANSQREGRPREITPARDKTAWLDRRKNLSGHAFAEERRLVRVGNPEGSIYLWCERAEVDAKFEAGWTLA